MMIQASILFVLLVAGSIGVQAGQFEGHHLKGPAQYKECAEFKFDGPLGRTSPTKYGLKLIIEDSEHTDVYILGVKIDDSQAQKGEPKDVVVLHMDRSVNVYSLEVSEERAGSKLILPIESMCQDSARQLLVVKFKEEIADNSTIEMAFSLDSSIRNDNRGIHWDGASIKASFSEKEARLTIPCFDDNKYKADTKIMLTINASYNVSSETCHIESQSMVLIWHEVDFTEMTSSSLSEFSFKASPHKRGYLN